MTPRQVKTPAQRAQEAVGVLERRLTKLVAQRAAVNTTLQTLDKELDVTRVRLAYAKQSPDIPPRTNKPTEEKQ